MKRLIDKNSKKFYKTISCEENKSKLSFLCNEIEFYSIHLEDKKYEKLLEGKLHCDYIIISSNLSEIALWVELKGKDIEWALKQIESSVNEFWGNVSKKYAAIVCSKVPPNPRKWDSQKQIFIKRTKINQLFLKSQHLQLKYDVNSKTVSNRL